jgi:hypothetical protein
MDGLLAEINKRKKDDFATAASEPARKYQRRGDAEREREAAAAAKREAERKAKEAAEAEKREADAERRAGRMRKEVSRSMGGVHETEPACDPGTLPKQTPHRG